MVDEEGNNRFEWFTTYGWAVLVLIIAIIVVLYFQPSIFFPEEPDDCLVTKEWFEEAFGQPIDDVGRNYEVRDGRICITNEVLLKEIYNLREER